MRTRSSVCLGLGRRPATCPLLERVRRVSECPGDALRVEDGHQTRVRAGENRGETLNHESVVREYVRLPVWDGGGRAEWAVSAQAGEAGHPSRWLAVAVDAQDGKVLQAVEIGC